MAKSATAVPRAAGQRQAEGFWHRPDWMNLVSDVLLVIASVLISYAAVKAVLRAPWFGLHQVVIASPIGQVTAAQLEYAAASSLRGNFFTVDLGAAREAFEKLPWVRHAQLRRVWPGTVEVTLEEHAAAAFWRDTESADVRLLNTFGEIFDAASNAALPVFSGPPDAGKLMLSRRQEIDGVLQAANKKVTELTLSNRFAWQARLADNMLIELGRDQGGDGKTLARLQRFVAVLASTEEQLGAPIHVADLRYPNGFAVTAQAANKKGNP